MWIILLFVLALFYFIYRWRSSSILRDLDKRAVFITGCDTGFGHLLVLRLLSYNMPVFAGCLTQKGINELKAKSKSLSGKLDAFLLDVSSDKSVQSVAEYLKGATKPYGGLHGIVNNAGILGPLIFDDFLTVDDYKKTSEVNLWGMIRVTQALKPLVKKKRGRIVSTTSVLGRMVVPNFGPYIVSKHGASGYCDLIRQELRPFGVSVHILEPGLFNTPIITGPIDRIRFWKTANKELKREYGEKIICRRFEELVPIGASDDLSWVVDCYFHALTSIRPKVRYHPGWDSQLVYMPFSVLPSSIQDFISEILANLTGQPKPAATIKKTKS